MVSAPFAHSVILPDLTNLNKNVVLSIRLSSVLILNPSRTLEKGSTQKSLTYHVITSTGSEG